jgi:hypothetical protein
VEKIGKKFVSLLGCLCFVFKEVFFFRKQTRERERKGNIVFCGLN